MESLSPATFTNDGVDPGGAGTDVMMPRTEVGWLSTERISPALNTVPRVCSGGTTT